MKVRVGQDDANCVLSLLLLDHTFPSEQVKLLHPRLEDGGDGVVDMISRMLRKRRVDPPSGNSLGAFWFRAPWMIMLLSIIF